MLSSTRLEDGVETYFRPPILGDIVVGMATRKAEHRVLPAAVNRQLVAKVPDFLAAYLQILQTTCEFMLSLLCEKGSTVVKHTRECTCLQHEVHCVRDCPFPLHHAYSTQCSVCTHFRLLCCITRRRCHLA